MNNPNERFITLSEKAPTGQGSVLSSYGRERGYVLGTAETLEDAIRVFGQMAKHLGRVVVVDRFSAPPQVTHKF